MQFIYGGLHIEQRAGCGYGGTPLKLLVEEPAEKNHRAPQWHLGLWCILAKQYFSWVWDSRAECLAHRWTREATCKSQLLLGDLVQTTDNERTNWVYSNPPCAHCVSHTTLHTMERKLCLLWNVDFWKANSLLLGLVKTVCCSRKRKPSLILGMGAASLYS